MSQDEQAIRSVVASWIEATQRVGRHSCRKCAPHFTQPSLQSVLAAKARW